MPIGWYPGHMAAARKDAAATLAKVDLVIELVDARCPGASTNPLVERLRLARQRPALRLLNKADLADAQVTQAWLRAIEGQPATRAIALSAKKPGDVARIQPLAQSLVPHRDGPAKPVRALVMGVPNVGKSTLINALLRRKATKVGDEPGVTRHQTRHQVNDRFDLIDMPGLMWPEIEHASDGLMLAAVNTIGVNAYDEGEVAAFLAETIAARHPGALADRYGPGLAAAETDGDGPAMLEAIAVRRGLRGAGGRIDVERAARALLADFRDGALGRMSLETPASRAAMIAAAAANDASR